jgi:hypothetical protein
MRFQLIGVQGRDTVMGIGQGIMVGGRQIFILWAAWTVQGRGVVFGIGAVGM